MSALDRRPAAVGFLSRGLRLLSAAGPLLALWAPPLAAQAPAAPPRQAPTPGIVFSEEVAVEWITVPVIVSAAVADGGEGLADPRGANLTAAAFQLRIDGRLVQVESFDHGAAPFSLLFAQDLSGSMAHGDKLRLSRNGLALVLARAGERDEVAILTFAGPLVDLQVPFTADFRLLDTAPNSWRAYGTTALYDALSRVTEIVEDSHRSRRAVMLVSDGIDNASTVGADQARSLLQGAGLPVFVIDVAARFERAGLAAVPTAPGPAAVVSAADPVAFSLAELAATTGGRYIEVLDHSSMQAAADQVVRDLRQQYQLGFTTDGGEASWHRIEVTVPIEKGETPLTLRFRTRYFGAAPASWAADSAVVTSAAPAATSRRGGHSGRS